VKKVSPYISIIAVALFLALGVGRTQAQNSPAAKASGDVTQVQPGQLTVHSAQGDVQVMLPDGVKLVRVPPGAKNLDSAVVIQATDITPGDRVVVIGHPGDQPQTINAVRVVVMSKSDLTSYHESEVRDWQTRGIEGNVKTVDTATGDVTLSVPNRPPTPGNLTHPVVVTTTPKTTVLRYAQNSVQFADAKPSGLDALKVGDQVRALGTVSSDGTHYAAEKLIFGTFQNIGATVISVDPGANTLTVKDLANGKPVVVHAGQGCKMHQLSPFLAQAIARMTTGGGSGGSGRGQGGGAASADSGGSPGGGGGHRGGVSNLSQALENMPIVTLNDIKRGDPVVIFSMQGTTPSEVTAIFILTGVEPILAAQPKGGGEVNLGSWNLSLGGGGSEGGP
jgi:hypothetical protein